MKVTTLTMVFGVTISLLSSLAGAHGPLSATDVDDALATARQEGRARIMVTLEDGPPLADILVSGLSPGEGVVGDGIQDVMGDFIARLGGQDILVVRVFEDTPTIVMDASADAISAILEDDLVTSVTYLPDEMEVSGH